MAQSFYTDDDFEGVSDSTQKFLVELANTILRISISITKPQCILASIGVIVNIFHLLVLSRKTITKNSINVIMIAIGFCDLFNMSFNVYDNLMILIQYNDRCRPPVSYAVKLFGFWASAFEDHALRLSSLFGVIMALIRFLVVKNALNPKFNMLSKPLFALATIFIAFIFSTIMTLLFWSRYELVEVKPWKPPIQCTEFPFGFTAPRYKSSIDDVYFTEVSLALQIFSIVDGVIKLIPTCIFPILTFLLIKELRKADKSRQKISSKEKKDENSKTDQTTKLVILMAITYTAAEGPLGIIYIIQGFVTQPYGLVELSFDLIDVLSVFIAINSISHCFICLAVSSQYQKSAKELLCFGKCSKSKTSPIFKPSVTMDPTVRRPTLR